MSEENRQAFTQLLEAHLVPLRRAAFRLCRDRTEAEDLVQEVCLRAFEKRGQLMTVTSPRGWLMRVQYNLYVDRGRRAGRMVTIPFDDDVESAADGCAGGDPPRSLTETALLVEALGRVWSALKPEQRALLAYYAEGYSLRELVEITGLPLSALKARLHRARIRLGKMLDTDTRTTHLKAVSGDKR